MLLDTDLQTHISHKPEQSHRQETLAILMQMSHNNKSENPIKINACQYVTMFISLQLAVEFFGVPACTKHVRSRAAWADLELLALRDYSSTSIYIWGSEEPGNLPSLSPSLPTLPLPQK